MGQLYLIEKISFCYVKVASLQLPATILRLLNSTGVVSASSHMMALQVFFSVHGPPPQFSLLWSKCIQLLHNHRP